MVSQIITPNQAIILACDSLLGCFGSFTISNTPGGGVSIFANSVFDGNSYTAGNMSSITFENSFINPCGALNFTTSINSELGDTDIQTFNYALSSISSTISPIHINERVLIKITDLLGREVKKEPRKTLIYIYSDGYIEKKIIVE
tara:strand:- start:79 stop:513 length:435 start_codon:yes stop_codon:yes gene_type:complete